MSPSRSAPLSLLALALSAACDPPADPGDSAPPFEAEIDLSVPADAEAHPIDPRFVSYSVDTAQVVDAPFWDPDGTYPPTVSPGVYDFSRERLRNLARALSPAVLRIGGTDADKTWFCDDGGPCDAPPDGYEHVMTPAQLQGVVDFAADVGADLLFTLNCGPGPRDGEGRLLTSQAEAISGAIGGAVPVAAWEAGNETNAFGVTFLGALDYGPERFAEDVSRLGSVLDEAIAGPATIFWSVGETPPFLADAMAAVQGAPDPGVVTWHYYATNSDRCPFRPVPTTPENLLDDAVALLASEHAATVRDLAPGRVVWNGEMAGGLCGGEAGVTDTLADALWYGDALAQMAVNGTRLVVRQNLSGADYGLLSEPSLEPRPSFYVAWLVGRLKGDAVQGVVAAQGEHRSRVRAWAFPRGPEAGAWTGIWLANPRPEPVRLSLALEGLEVASAQAWWIEAGGDLAATSATVNGVGPTQDGSLLAPEDLPERPEPVAEGRAWVELPAYGLGMVRLDPA